MKRYARKKKYAKKKTRFVRKRSRRVSTRATKNSGRGRLQVSRFSARKPFGDKAIVKLRFTNSVNCTSTTGGTGILPLGSQKINDLLELRNNLGIAPGMADYAKIWLDYKVHGIRIKARYFPDLNSDPAQMLFFYSGAEVLPSTNRSELLERDGVVMVPINSSSFNSTRPLYYSAQMKRIEPIKVITDQLQYCGSTTLSDPWHTAPAEFLRWTVGLTSMRNTGYASTTSQGHILVEVTATVEYWNRRQQTHA